MFAPVMSEMFVEWFKSVHMEYANVGVIIWNCGFRFFTGFIPISSDHTRRVGSYFSNICSVEDGVRSSDIQCFVKCWIINLSLTYLLNVLFTMHHRLRMVEQVKHSVNSKAHLLFFLARESWIYLGISSSTRERDHSFIRANWSSG